jgi:hypothetical protein
MAEAAREQSLCSFLHAFFRALHRVYRRQRNWLELCHLCGYLPSASVSPSACSQ